MKPFKNLSLFRVEGETETLDPFTPVSYTHLDVYKRQTNDNT